MKHGDFSELAKEYARYRAGYSEFALDAILGLIGKTNNEINFVDVGAGTGIWTRMVAKRGCKTIAIEPNDEMRQFGQTGNDSLKINWLKGSAENTGLAENSCDLVTMASSFHWPNFDVAMKEFNRILRPNGLFVALWNTRLIELNPLLVEIEEHLKKLVPDMKRISSGRSEFCEHLTERLAESHYIKNVLYMEGRHVEYQTPEHYIGLWRSVNDVRVQAGAEKFEQFIQYITDRISHLEFVEAAYLTRIWIAQKKSC
jgi:ubiquinone/menaquinone biosynthesis C-methylase UbiE